MQSVSGWDIISIPYGAIKRQPQFAVLSAFFYISIPYGAIKRIVKESFVQIITSFQFLMVRLKDISEIK